VRVCLGFAALVSAAGAGLSPEATRDEINKFVEKRKIEVYDNYIIVDNIADMKRIVDTRSGLSEQK